MGTSSAPQDEQVTVNLTSAPALRVALFVVICPQGVLIVTPLVLAIPLCVTVLPAPAAYPDAAEEELDVIAPVVARLVPVAAPMTGVVSVGVFRQTTPPVPVCVAPPSVSSIAPTVVSSRTV